jgi:glutaredoxin
MNSTTITCPYCKKSFEISDAIGHQIEEELLRAKAEQTEMLKREFDTESEVKIKEAVQTALTEANQTAQLQLERER